MNKILTVTMCSLISLLYASGSSAADPIIHLDIPSCEIPLGDTSCTVNGSWQVENGGKSQYSLWVGAGDSWTNIESTKKFIEKRNISYSNVGPEGVTFKVYGNRKKIEKDLKATLEVYGDYDSDGDGVLDREDAFPNDASETKDSDGDGVGDNADAFPNNADETIDTDGDGVGDNADAFPNDASETLDTDGDGVGNNADAFPDNASETADSDGDGVGDNADAFPNDATETIDSDGDGVGDNADAFPTDATETTDTDSDGVGDNTDAFPNNPSETTDTDNDGVGDNADAFPGNPGETMDSDGDGVGDNADVFPLDASESVDSDGDGVGDNADAFPIDPAEALDTDADGVGDNADAFPNDATESADTDGDGVGDNADAFPNDATETLDSDGDGVGDNGDAFPDDANETADSDNDGLGDNADAFPNDPTETLDTDGDFVGNNADLDDDGDSIDDIYELANGLDPLNPLDALGDLDSDTYSNLEEYVAGSDPNDVDSIPNATVSQFSASSSIISQAGVAVTLSWVTINGDNVELEEDVNHTVTGSLEYSSSLIVNPQQTTTYTLTVSSSGGEDSKSLTITVDTPAPGTLWSNSISLGDDQFVSTSITVADDGSSYVGALNNNYYKVDSNGTLKWQLEGVGMVLGKAVLTPTAIIIGAGGSDPGGSSVPGQIAAFTHSGILQWSHITDSAVMSSPVITPGGATVYGVSYRGTVYALDASNGTELWQFPLGALLEVVATPALSASESTLIVQSIGKIFAIDLAETEPVAGRIVWEKNL